MQHQEFKKILIVCAFFLLGPFSLSTTVHAAGSIKQNYTQACKELESATWSGAPSPMAIICPIVRIMNVLVLSAGAVFVVFIFVSAIKYALSQGDPKALQAAQQTLTTTIIGFIIVIGVWTILTIITNVFGFNSAILNPFGTLNDSLKELFQELSISD